MTIKHDETPAHDSNLPEWQPVEETQPAEPPISHAKSAVDQSLSLSELISLITPEKVEKAVEWEPFPAKEETIEAPVEFNRRITRTTTPKIIKETRTRSKKNTEEKRKRSETTEEARTEKIKKRNTR